MTVEMFGLVVPRSKRAMTGWLTPLISSSCFCVTICVVALKAK